MPKSKLPDIKTQDWKDEVEVYLKSDIKQRTKLAKKHGYYSTECYMNAMANRGLYLPDDIKRKAYAHDAPTSVKKEEPENTVHLPPVNIIKYKAPRVLQGDEEIAILHSTDGHAGKITKSFNDDIYKKRMEQTFHSMMTIINLHRNMYPIRQLKILNTGDNNQGENPHQGSIIGDVSMGERDQVKKLSAPAWNDLLGTAREHFEVVDFYGVSGNHGHDKLAPETSTSDLMLYDVLEAGIGQQEGINIHSSNDWYMIVTIFGYKCLLFHGDGIPCQQGVPFFALDKKLKSWHMQFNGFRYAFSGHFHKRYSNEVSSVLEHFMAASLVSDDNWALKQLGISSSPSQSLYGFHPRHGITWRYPLIVDEKYKPDEHNGQ